ncbi:MAG: DUF3488 domain-containing protein [Roseovarius sp.]
MKHIAPLLTLLLALGFAASPFLSPGFNGFEADQFPVPQIDPPAQPAGYAFAIWGLIYLVLIAGAIFGLLYRADDAAWYPMRAALMLSLTIGAAWLPVAQISPFWATVMIWAMLITALSALVRAGHTDRLWLRLPIALYAGWLTAASAVALALMLAGHGILGQTTAAIVCLGFGLIIAAVVQTIRADTPEYSAAVIWALVGVVVSNLEPQNLAVLGLSAAGIVALSVLAWQGHRRLRISA